MGSARRTLPESIVDAYVKEGASSLGKSIVVGAASFVVRKVAIVLDVKKSYDVFGESIAFALALDLAAANGWVHEAERRAARRRDPSVAPERRIGRHRGARPGGPRGGGGGPAEGPAARLAGTAKRSGSGAQSAAKSRNSAAIGAGSGAGSCPRPRRLRRGRDLGRKGRPCVAGSTSSSC